jgi:GTPase SAR1 family protein
MQIEERLFTEAAHRWNIDKFYEKLTQAKQFNTSRKARFTSLDKAILRGLLCGYAPKKIATSLNWTQGALSVELTKGLYRYVETVTDREPYTLKNWRDISSWLEEAGYKKPPSSQDLREAPDLGCCYGRHKELEQLTQWIVRDKYRLVTLLGMPGIGKTTLALQFARNVKDEFDRIVWRNLPQGKTFREFLEDLLQCVTQEREENLPTTINEQIDRLMEYLRSSHCLIILDGLEEILQSDRFTESWCDYSLLMRRIAEETHQSCLLLTTQDEPKNLVVFAGNKADSMQLGSLGEASQEILKEKCLSDSNYWHELIECYQGNPLVLKLVATTIKELFAGSVNILLELNQEAGIFIPLLFQELLSKQFGRLSSLEKQILHLLAINPQPMSLKNLPKKFNSKISLSRLIESLTSLKRRSLVEIHSNVDGINITLRSMLISFVLRESKNNSTQHSSSNKLTA